MEDWEQLLEPLDLQATGAIVHAVSRGYATRNVINERFPHEELANVVAGGYRNRQIDEHILSGVPSRAPHISVNLNKIKGTGHAFVTLQAGQLLLLVGPRPFRPRHARLPRKCKYRLNYALRSRLQPAQMPLFGDNSAPVKEPVDGFVLGMITHYADERNKAVMGGVDLLIIDQAYCVRASWDLTARLESLRNIQPVQPSVIPFPVRIKS